MTPPQINNEESDPKCEMPFCKGYIRQLTKDGFICTNCGIIHLWEDIEFVPYNKGERVYA